MRCTDGGGRTSEWTNNLTLVFVDITGDPVFEVPDWETDFTENSTGLSEMRTLPYAIDPKNVGIEDPTLLAPIYYFIDRKRTEFCSTNYIFMYIIYVTANYNPEDAKLFKLDPLKRELRLTDEIDREKIDRHIFRVVATNRQSYPAMPQQNSFLIVNVTVNDVNDNPPSFEYPIYGSGITSTDLIGKHILTVKVVEG